MHRLLSAIPLLILAQPAPAWTPLADAWCDRADVIERSLSLREGAVRQAQGIRDPESLMQLWTDRHGGWTLVVAHADGQSCIVGMGDAWQGDAPTADKPLSVAGAGAISR